MKPKVTTGAWSSQSGPIYFLASNASVGTAIAGPPVRGRFQLIPLDALFNARNRAWLDRALDSGTQVLLDSGIFALASAHARDHGLTFTEAVGLDPTDLDGFEKLWDTFGEIAQAYGPRLWGMIELDQGGAETKRATRARIEAEFGVVPMPVYHPMLDGWEYFDEIAAGYDRICLGGIAAAPSSHRLRLLHTMYERARDHPGLWLHILGLTPSEWVLASAPKGSCDSSTWTTNVRWPEAQRVRAALQGVDRLPASFAYIFGADKLSALDEFEERWSSLPDDHDVAINPVGRFRALQFGAAQASFHGRTWTEWWQALEANDLRPA